jgi:hypothetical protein
MSNSYVGFIPDSSGKKIQAFSNVIGGNTVLSQAVTIADTLGAAIIQLIGSAVPASAILIGGSDGTNLQAFKTDTSGNLSVIQSGTWTFARSWSLSSGSDSVTVVPSGTQTISGTITANQGGSWAVTANAGTNLNTSALALDTTVSTMSAKLPASLVGGRLDENIGSWLGSTAPTVGSKTSANSIPVVIASDQGAVPASQSGTWNVTNISGTVSLPTGASTAANQTTLGNQTTKINDGTNTAAVKAASTAAAATDPALVVVVSPNNTVAVTQAANTVNAANSTTATLLANAVFTGTGVDCTASAIGSINVLALSDQNSALNGMQLQFSSDNVHWDHANSLTLFANQSVSLSISPQSKFFRIVYTNGTVNQGSFRLQTFVSIFPNTNTVKDLDTLITNDDNAGLTRAILTGRATSTATVYTDVLTDVYGTLQVGFNGAAADAFGRARVSEPVALFNAQFQYDTNPLLFQTSLTGTGTVTKSANETSVMLSTGGTANGAQAINQTKQYHKYQPGKSMQILMTGFLGAQKTNVRSRIGYFDANDGVYVEMDGTAGPSINQRTSTSGSPVTTSVTQANWNFDKFDGTGPSGITIDFSKTQIFMFDLQWLGVGRVRVGFYINGLAFIGHVFNNANTLTSPYMNSANLPCRAEITNTGVAASTTSMKQICVSVNSEGGTSFPSVLHFSTNNGITSISVTTRAPILSIRPKTTFNSLTNRSQIQVETIEIINISTANVFWELVYNGTLTGAAFADVDTTNSGVQRDVTASAITNGQVVASGYIGGGSKFSETVPLTTVLPFTLDFAGTTPDIYTLVVTSFGAAVSVNGTFIWSENR